MSQDRKKLSQDRKKCPRTRKKCPRTGKECPRTFFPAGRFQKSVLVLSQDRKNVLGHFFPRADFRKVSLSCPRTGKKCPRTFFPAGRFEKNVLVLSQDRKKMSQDRKKMSQDIFPRGPISEKCPCPVLGQEKNVLGHFFQRADLRKMSLSCPRTGKKCPRTGKKCPRTFFPAGRFQKNVLVLSQDKKKCPRTLFPAGRFQKNVLVLSQDKKKMSQDKKKLTLGQDRIRPNVTFPPPPAMFPL